MEKSSLFMLSGPFYYLGFRIVLHRISENRSVVLLLWKAGAESARRRICSLSPEQRASEVGWSIGDWGGGGVCPRLNLARLPLCHPGPNPPSSAHSASVLPHCAPLDSARTRIHATRTQNGDGREPEQPVRRGLPPRPLVTVENFIFQTAWRITHLRSACPHRWLTPGIFVCSAQSSPQSDRFILSLFFFIFLFFAVKCS